MWFEGRQRRRVSESPTFPLPMSHVPNAADRCSAENHLTHSVSEMAKGDSTAPPASMLNRGALDDASDEVSPVTRQARTECEADFRTSLANCARLLAIAERDGQARANEAAALRTKAEQYDRLASALSSARQEQDALLASTSWRLTAPLRALIERLRRGQPGARRTMRTGQSVSGMVLPSFGGETFTHEVVPPSAFPEPWPAGPPRTTLLVDRFRTGDLAGGARCATILAAAMAQQQRAPLRVISRLAPPEPTALELILAQYGIDYDGNPSFDWLTDTGRGPVAGITAAERIVVGDWVDAGLALEAVSADRVVYVVDQVEVHALIGAKADRRARNIFGSYSLALVFTDARVRDDLRQSGLFEHRDAGTPSSVLPAVPRGSDWQRTAAQLLDVGPRG